MPEQFTVPQFIDTEDKIFGPITARQFVILMVVLLTEAVFYKLFSFLWFIVLGLPLLSLGVIVAFAKINGQHFHYFILNLIQTLRKPRLRVWDKNLTNAEVQYYLKEEEVPPLPPKYQKQPLGTSRLAELALVVNTGGMYVPEE